MTEVIFYFDFGSPNAYLAHKVIPEIERRTGAKFTYVPALLGGIFKATGNQAPMVAFTPIKGKFEYEMLEIRRFVARHRFQKFRLNPHFPVNTLMLMRGLVAAQEAGSGAAYLEMGLAGMWEEGLKLDDKEVLARRIDAAGLDSVSLMAAAQTDRVKQKLAENNGGYQALNMGDSSYGKFDKRIYTDLNSDHPIDLCRYQVINCFAGRSGLINSGGASGANDFEEAVTTAVINKRAGGTGLISGRKAFQRPMKEGVQLLNAIQDVYLSPEVTVA